MVNRPRWAALTLLVIVLLILVSCGSDQEGQPSNSCDASYPTICIPSPPPDLDCGEIPHREFPVIGTDPHGFDRDIDGIGCESG